jgi:hypothetical protein
VRTCGSHSPGLATHYVLFITQANGYSFWPQLAAWGWLRFKSEKVQSKAPHFNVLLTSLCWYLSALGARVIACASPSKLDVARAAGGADFAVDYTKEGWQKEVLKITGGQGVDVVYDPVGRIKGMPRSPSRANPNRFRLYRFAEMYCVEWSGNRRWLCWW